MGAAREGTGVAFATTFGGEATTAFAVAATTELVTVATGRAAG